MAVSNENTNDASFTHCERSLHAMTRLFMQCKGDPDVAPPQQPTLVLVWLGEYYMRL
jgi:hypothetical protein